MFCRIHIDHDIGRDKRAKKKNGDHKPWAYPTRQAVSYEPAQGIIGKVGTRHSVGNGGRKVGYLITVLAAV
jgi:hypothetical protein